MAIVASEAATFLPSSCSCNVGVPSSVTLYTSSCRLESTMASSGAAYAVLSTDPLPTSLIWWNHAALSSFGPRYSCRLVGYTTATFINEETSGDAAVPRKSTSCTPLGTTSAPPGYVVFSSDPETFRAHTPFAARNHATAPSASTYIRRGRSNGDALAALGSAAVPTSSGALAFARSYTATSPP